MQQSKPSYLIKIAVLFVQCILAGCTSLSTSSNLEEGPQFLSVAIISTEGEMQLPYASDEPALIVGLLATGGSLVGQIDQKQRILFPATQESFSLPSKSSIFGSILDELRELQHSSHPEIAIQPAEAKIARIAVLTFDRYLYENDFKRDIGYSSLVDTMSGNDLVMIAVDRPCHIVGSLSLERDTVKFDVRFQSAGVHYLTAVRAGNRQTIVTELPRQVRPKLVVDTYESYRNWIASNPPSKGIHRTIPVIAN